MSVAYYPKNPQAKGNMDDGNFDLSSAACDVIGTIHRMIGCGIAFDNRWCPPRTAFKGECLIMAQKIRELPKSRLAVAHRSRKYAFKGNLEEFCEFVYAWADFLETCDGYEIQT